MTVKLPRMNHWKRNIRDGHDFQFDTHRERWGRWGWGHARRRSRRSIVNIRNRIRMRYQHFLRRVDWRRNVLRKL